MHAALLLALTLSPAHAGDATPPAPAAAAPAAAPAVPTEPSTPAADQQPNAGTESVATPYALRDFDATVGAELKQMEEDAKESTRQIDSQYDAQKALETRQLKEKFEFLHKQRDERVAYQRSLIDDWKKFVEKLRAVEPAERGAEKLAYDQKTMEARHKFAEEQTARSKEFLDRQQRERDQFWVKLQQDNNEQSRQQVDRANKWGKTAPPR